LTLQVSHRSYPAARENIRHMDKFGAQVGRLISAKLAARELGIPYTSLRDLTFRGEIPVVKIGRAWYFERRDLTEGVRIHKERLSDPA